MKLGMNLLLWGTAIDESLFPVLEQIKAMGFDGVEVDAVEHHGAMVPQSAARETYRAGV